MEFKKYLIVKIDNVLQQYNLVEPVAVNQLDRFVRIKYWYQNGSDYEDREIIFNLDIIKEGL